MGTGKQNLHKNIDNNSTHFLVQSPADPTITCDDYAITDGKSENFCTGWSRGRSSGKSKDF